jgi:hypothetical protein
MYCMHRMHLCQWTCFSNTLNDKQTTRLSNLHESFTTQPNIITQYCQWLVKTGTTNLPGTSLHTKMDASHCTHKTKHCCKVGSSPLYSASNLGLETCYNDYFHGSTQSHQANSTALPNIRPQTLLSKFFLIHYLLIIPPVIWYNAHYWQHIHK